MACHKYRNTNFRPDSLERIEQVNTILEDYPDQRLTTRQVYYQFVSRGWLENNPKNYKNLAVLLTDARYAGMADWDVIEDRGREPSTPSEWNDIEGLMESAMRAYRLPRWAGQDCYAELWCEKQALAGVLQPLASKYHVTLMVNKGYSSASAMKQAADRMREACGFESPEWHALQEEMDPKLSELESGSDEYQKFLRDVFQPRLEQITKRCVLFYLGDHDPSGEDMVRDITERLKEFKVLCLTVQKLALTMKQVKQFDPPPNPAKLTDSRAKAYIAKYGEHSWELDALPPRELNRIVEAAFRSVLDMKKMQRIIEQEKQDMERLRKALKTS
jgi:hypothetical protein